MLAFICAQMSSSSSSCDQPKGEPTTKDVKGGERGHKTPEEVPLLLQLFAFFWCLFLRRHRLLPTHSLNHHSNHSSIVQKLLGSRLFLFLLFSKKNCCIEDLCLSALTDMFATPVKWDKFSGNFFFFFRFFFLFVFCWFWLVCAVV